MDVATGEVLFEKDARVAMSPASMTKIMTAHMVFDALKNGVITPNTKYLVSNEAWKRGGVSSGSSTMFLEAGSSVSVMDLLRGIVIQSGNDACIAIAEGMAGNEEYFAKRMTVKAKELGLTTANFKNSTGWPHPEHKISAYDLASLTKQSMNSHPDYFSIYSEGSFTWNGITQNNRNPLLGKFSGADGVKTGSTKDSGYGLVGSATIGENRRIIVVNGLASKSQRSSVSQKLMQAAFNQFKVYALYKKNDIDYELMKANNSIVIPRNHHVDNALKEAENSNYKPLKELVEVLTTPYNYDMDSIYTNSPKPNERIQYTYCGT